MSKSFLDEIYKWAESKSPWLKQCGIEALSELGDIRAFPIFIENLKNENPDVRYYSIKGLVNIGNPKALKYLFFALETEKDDEIIQKINDAIISLADRSCYADILPFLESKNVLVRGLACEVLGYLKEVRAVPHIVNLLSDSNKEVKRLAAEALGSIGDRKASRLIFNLIREKGEDEVFLEGAIWALGNLKEVSAKSFLIKLSEHSNPEIRASAIWALGKIGSVDTTEIFIKGLSDEDVNVRYESVLALGKVKDSESVKYLLKALEKEKDDEIKSTIIEVLARIGNPTIISTLINQLHNPSISVRMATINAIKKLGIKEAIPYLINLLKDEDDLVREAARSTLLFFKRKYLFENEDE
ncbi:MAG: HEAT repeat domain-containing protein [Candidatus Odinarchaeota archaeon]|nr:HEAT repeat domain-containing protein [Candidatus Odinarchaeota archaeon]